VPETAEKTIHILLLDDHALFRESVGRLLAAEPGFHVAAHCGTIKEALQVLKQKPIEVVLLDFDLGEHDGTEFVRLAATQGFKGKILVVTAGVDQKAATELIRSGISGVFLKRDSAALLAQGIRDVMAGKVWLDQEQLQTALRTEVATPQENRTKPFTEREQQVLSCVFEGLANKEIADRLGVSESSVKATLQQLFSKTGVRTRSQLVRIVLEQHRDQL
jgi:two-component system, NarL family, nitrate/nitrite response regulator NarL